MVYLVMNTNTKYYDYSELNYLIVLDSSIYLYISDLRSSFSSFILLIISELGGTIS